MAPRPKTIGEELIAEINDALASDQSISEFQLHGFARQAQRLKGAYPKMGYCALGIIAGLQRKHDACTQYFSLALKFAPNDSYILHNYVLSLLSLGAITEAADQLEPLMENTPDAEKKEAVALAIQIYWCLSDMESILDMDQRFPESLNPQQLAEANALHTLMQKENISGTEIRWVNKAIEETLLATGKAGAFSRSDIKFYENETGNILSIQQILDCDLDEVVDLNIKLSENLAAMEYLSGSQTCLVSASFSKNSNCNHPAR
jgi:tetratricopeptide (TPR) repeat protein